jgi:hypothetical protein
MAIVINGSGTVTGISVGGLPDGIVDAGTLAANATSKIEDNIALLGFYRASDNAKAKYSLVDQVIDEYVDATGVDAGNSTNEALSGGIYYGGTAAGSATKTFSYQGSNEAWTIPIGVSSITVKSWGAGGSAGGYLGHGGGGGGYSTAVFSVTGGTAMVGVVGQGGGGYNTNGSTPGTTGTYGGGGPGVGSSATDGNGGAGGGFSGLFAGSYTQSNAIIIAGGGGAGGYGGSIAAVGGGGGGTTGNAASGGSYVGGGGTQSAGGAGGSATTTNGTAGSALQGGTGGHGSYYAGGGGGGYYGGGGAGSTGGEGASGSGGGSGFVRASSFPTGVSASSSSTLTAGSNGSGTAGGAEANSSDSDSSGAGGADSGGNANNAAASNGALFVDYTGAVTTGSDLTLQSVATTAKTAPTTGDIVILIEDITGTATINTDIKAYISRNGSAFSSQVTLTDEGSWGTNKKILAAHNIDISGITSGTSMKYKITTHNQSGSKATSIHATSLAWA